LGLNMAITELDSDKALCKTKKMTVARVHLPNAGQWDQYIEVERKIDIKKATEKLGQAKMDEIFKRSRLRAVEVDEMSEGKIKDPADQKTLEPFVKAIKTGWIAMDKVPSDKKAAVLAAAKKEDAVTEWDLVEFDDMYATCARCGMSWDNKKGCVGNFGPTGSPVPDLAKKYGLTILKNVNEAADQKKRFTSKDADSLLKEITVIREKSPAEGKMTVRRIEGTLNRLEAMAKCSKEYEVGFYFF
jgi:hypothetical protein